MITEEQQSTLENYFVNEEVEKFQHPMEDDNLILIAKRESGMTWSLLRKIFTSDKV